MRFRKNNVFKFNVFIITALIIVLLSGIRVCAEIGIGEDVNRVLLIEENLPWKSNANTEVLNSMGLSVTKINMLDFSTIDLTPYYMVIVANDQDLGFYEDYNTVKSKLAEYVEKGGILLMGACDSGWSKGTLTSGLPGEVQLAPLNYDNYNYIADNTHPIATGELTDNVQLTDADLYSNYCSHREFLESTLPEGSRVILRSKTTNNPTLVEYPYGLGKVIASGLTWEHSYVQHTGNSKYGTFAKKSMDDYFAYGISLISFSKGYEFKSSIGVEFEQTSRPSSGVKIPKIKEIYAEYNEEGNYYDISIIDYTADSKAEPFFFWESYDGYFIGASEYYKSVKFISNPGKDGKMVKVTAYIGDNLGYTNNYIIELEGKSPMSEEGMEVEIINSFSNVKAGEIYEIEYSAKQSKDGKFVPGTSVDIYYTLNGEDWIQIARGLLDKTSYKWLVPSVKSGFAKIKIVAQNGTKIKTVESLPFEILSPSYYVEGRVLDANGFGVSGVRVKCGETETITDNSGYYIIRGLEEGSYVIVVDGENKSFVKNSASVYLDGNNYCAYKIFRVK